MNKMKVARAARPTLPLVLAILTSVAGASAHDGRASRGGGARGKAAPAGAGTRPRASDGRSAVAPRYLFAAVEGQERDAARRCREADQLNLSGDFNGLYFLNKEDKEGTRATLRVRGNTFELKSDQLSGSGIISGVNSCGETAVALKFTRAAGEESGRLANFIGRTISLDARIAGAQSAGRHDVDTFKMRKAIVLATTLDAEGRLAGPDIGFIICPPFPACQKYPRCPCPKPK